MTKTKKVKYIKLQDIIFCYSFHNAFCEGELDNIEPGNKGCLKKKAGAWIKREIGKKVVWK